MKTSSQKAPHSRANSSDNGAASSTVHRVALTRAETAEALGVSPRSVDMLIAGRRVNGLPVVYIGRKPVVPIDLLRAWLADQVRKENGSARL